MVRSLRFSDDESKEEGNCEVFALHTRKKFPEVN
jgi:hypothetical protein